MRSEMILSTTTASTMISGEPPLAMHYNNDDYVKLSCVDPKVAREKKFDLGGFTIPKNANEGGSKECIGVIVSNKAVSLLSVDCSLDFSLVHILLLQNLE